MRMYSDDFRELFLGTADESADDREVRLAVANEVLAELLEEGRDDEISFLNAVYAAQLSSRSVQRLTHIVAVTAA
ncbi:hypothetical protein [Streptomyces sp. NBC_01497]|uniref:hypothetical protein n=1 Tax=Streptomyces sp. NBC_01497 TaxID=2903885 RepID=UPI002E30CA6A|nr:hypothetical protein [Streptomyces sp. NBC_01497]